MHEWHRARDGCITRDTFRRNTAATRDSLELLLLAGTRVPHRRLVQTHPRTPRRFGAVEPTNNHAEQQLRGFVLWRKTTLGSHSERGDRFAAKLKSVIHTCRKQRRHVLTWLTRAIQAALSNRSAPMLLPTP